MSKYIPFTTEQKERAASVDLEEFLRRRGEKLITSGRDKRLASDHSITIRGCEWFDHATEQGGRAISFVKQFYGLSYPDAMSLLLDDDLGGSYPAAKEKVPEPAKPFTLPAQSESMRRVYAYLLKKRCIDREILNAFVRKKLIYESCEKSRDGTKEYHNAVFVGFDEHGVPRHGHKRGLYTMGQGYRGNIEGSDPKHSFHYLGGDDTLLVFEAPIDLLSYISLFPEIFQDFRDAFLLLGIHIKDLFAAGQLQPGGCQLHIGLGIMDLGDNADHLAVGHAGDAWGKQAVRLDS